MLLGNPALKARCPCLSIAAKILLAIFCATPLVVQAQSVSPPSGTQESAPKGPPDKTNSNVLLLTMGKAAHSMAHELTTVLPPNKPFHRHHRSTVLIRRIDYSVSSHPLPPQGAKAELEEPPNIESHTPWAPFPLVISQSEPAPVRLHRAPPAPEAAPVQEQVDVEIAPALTTQEIDEAKLETLSALEATEKNLALARGKGLNVSQQDLISKVLDFAENAREAARNGDWERARTLSKKARVLSASL